MRDLLVNLDKGNFELDDIVSVSYNGRAELALSDPY